VGIAAPSLRRQMYIKITDEQGKLAERLLREAAE
jgi:DNA-binding MarR family transcriptional regulator